MPRVRRVSRSERLAALPLSEAPLVALDVETTGLSPARGDRIIEIALVRRDPGEASEGWSVLVDPERPIPPEATRVHGIVDDAVEFTRRFVESGKPVGSICHGPQLLISANVLEGRTVTSVNKIRDDVRNAGGNYVDEELVVDDNLITSRVPKDLPAFNDALGKALGLS